MIDIGKELHWARAFDYRGIELAKLLKFNNTAEGFERFNLWLQNVCQKHEKTKIIDSNQGSQFTNQDYVDLLRSQGIIISMDGKGRALVFRTLKYENIYLNEIS